MGFEVVSLGDNNVRQRQSLFISPFPCLFYFIFENQNKIQQLC